MLNTNFDQIILGDYENNKIKNQTGSITQKTCFVVNNIFLLIIDSEGVKNTR